jgi:hypothetical protein
MFGHRPDAAVIFLTEFGPDRPARTVCRMLPETGAKDVPGCEFCSKRYKILKQLLIKLVSRRFATAAGWNGVDIFYRL